MRTRPILLTAAAIAAIAGAFLMVPGNSNANVDGTVAAQTVVFHAPKIGGMNLDSRLMGHMRASPTQTAERFCRNKGYSTVADLMLRASVATRTIADGTVHDDAGTTNQTFAMISCQSHPANAMSAG